METSSLFRVRFNAFFRLLIGLFFVPAFFDIVGEALVNWSVTDASPNQIHVTGKLFAFLGLVLMLWQEVKRYKKLSKIARSRSQLSS